MEMKNELYQSLETGLIDYNALSNEYLRPQLIINNYKKGTKVISHISQELKDSEEFMFSVAFITKSGIATMKQQLIELNDRGIKGRILASDYLNFTEPEALLELQKFENIEIRVVENLNFHAKGYIFKKKSNYSIIIGSSNLTQAALTYNNEWNLKITSLENGELIRETLVEYEDAWEKSTKVTAEWLEKYRAMYKRQKRFSREDDEIKIIDTIKPNKMQLDALKAIKEIREKGKNKALVISATGTGKTYLAAFDARVVNPKRYLFIVHREQIIDKSIESYKRILNLKDSEIGKISGGVFDEDKKYTFTTIQTLSRGDNMQRFKPEHFDYITIDEVHRATAKTYKKVIDYFQPTFMLGMTATPERTDGENIYELFDYNLAYEIRLQQALEEGMLAPFHYYGISDISINGELVDEETTFNQLISEERVKNIIEKIDLYGHEGEKAHGLIFCSRKDEAYQLSAAFNEKGYKTVALTGDDTQEERENSVASLESDTGLDYIFTVDIFNEGIDIPAVNQVIMLRATESSIIFIQQLGRGLRKKKDKEYVIVIDFIGNYKKNFLIPVALSGDNTFNKDDLKQYIMTGSSLLPGASTINFDRISAERIYQAIRTTTFSTKKMIKEQYVTLRNRTGSIPKLIDFLKHDAIDPQIIFEKYDYYEKLLVEMDENIPLLSEKEAQFLTFVSQEISNGKRNWEILLLQKLVNGNKITFSEFQRYLLDEYQQSISESDWNSILNILGLTFFVKSDYQKYGGKSFIVVSDNLVILSSEILELLKIESYFEAVESLLEYCIGESQKYFNKYKGTEFVLYKQYTKKDICRLLNWDKDEKGTLYGGRVKHGTLPIFVTYNKEDYEIDTQKYQDGFVNRHILNWETTSGSGINSVISTQIKKYKEDDLKIHLFVKKKNSEGSLFYYLGRMIPNLEKMQEVVREDKNNSKVTAIEYLLDVPVRNDVYEYLTSKIEDEEQ